MEGVLSQNSNKALVINVLLLVVIVCSNLFILWGLFGPQLSYQVQAATSEEPKIEQVADEKPKENRLIIPKIRLNEKITEGPTEAALNDGAWRIPSSSTPQLGGNTVLAGHRFTYQGKSIFYNLDKLKTGDEIGATYNGDTYKYEVKEILIVQPGNSEILEQTNESTLTLYTCTPLWTTKERLVVIAELTEGPQ